MRIAVYAFDGATMFHLAVPQMVFDEVARQGLAGSTTVLFSDQEGEVTTAEGYRLWVDDDGPGIPETQRLQVLERGSRLDEQVDGHGLGLGIVRDIVEAWGGRIALLESPQGGLRVSIDLPRKGR